jgi:hypothetical protein
MRLRGASTKKDHEHCSQGAHILVSVTEDEVKMGFTEHSV